MSRAKAGKKKSRGTGGARPVGPRPSVSVKEPPLQTAEILPAGGVGRKGTGPAPVAAAPRVDRVEPEEKSFYGETAVQMLGRVRRELRNIAILAVISFGVGFLVIQFVKI